ncbi:MAG: serine/threonine protein kinase, partial [Gemmataceae bacterium]|nr:serine/threonine protein kinase [Gemmataceae bacterium]
MPPRPPAGTTVTFAAGAVPTLTHASSAAAGFEEDTRVLLLWRLLIIHLAVVAIFLASGGMVLAGWLETPALGEPPAWWLPWQSAQFAELVVGAAVLWRWRGLSLRSLRWLEAVHFGVATVGGGLTKYANLAALPLDRAADPALAVGFVAFDSQMQFIMLVVVYGTVIPNAPRRSLVGVALMAAAAFLSTLAGAAANPPLRVHLPPLLVLCGMTLVIPSLVAVFVASRTHALRRRAVEAERRADELGPYTLRQKLGQGGMGEVWLAEHRLLKRPCAVKFIRPDLAANPATAARFAREVQAVTGLTHLNTIRVYDYGQSDDGSFYYVMEYLEGPTLDQLVKAHGPLPVARAVHLLRQLCGA